MKQLVYYSTALRLFTDDELLAILEPARAANAEAGITGMLLYVDGNFIQALEGPARALDRLFARIEADSRHRGVLKAFEMPIRRRNFAELPMGFRNMAKSETAGIADPTDLLLLPSQARPAASGAALHLLATFNRVIGVDQQLRWA